jgi:predicted RNA-binding protein with PIN domain
MPYLIDGHNLIPKMGLRLDSFDDEAQLLIRLQEFCRLRRTRVEVFFDGAPPGQVQMRKAGVVTAHFVRQGSSADAAIETRLTQLKRAARNWTVVSSDARVQRAAGAVHAGVLSAEEFSREMTRAMKTRMTASKSEPAINIKELEEWEEIFKKKGG